MTRSELRQLAERATQPEPWEARDHHDGGWTVLDANGMWLADIGRAPHDARFVAACDPQTILSLLSDLERLEAGLERAARELEVTGSYADEPGIGIGLRITARAHRDLAIELRALLTKGEER